MRWASLAFIAVTKACEEHRYPTLELFSKSRHCAPWEQTPGEIRGMSDLMHAAHAAIGPGVMGLYDVTTWDFETDGPDPFLVDT